MACSYSVAPTGKFMIQVLPPCGHAVHEDMSDKVSHQQHLHFNRLTKNTGQDVIVFSTYTI